MRSSPGEAVPHGGRDAYLDWALATDFRFFDTKGGVGLLIRWRSRETAQRALEIAKRFDVRVPPVYAGSGKAPVRRTWAVSVPVARVSAFLESTMDLSSQVELALPVSGNGSAPTSAKLNQSQSEQKYLVGVLDDGCVFANTLFQNSAGTRVLWLWNQDEAALGHPLDTASGPTPQCAFGYGGQWSFVDLDNITAQEVDGQALIYRRAGLPGLRRRAAHGPHVMDLLCGSRDTPDALEEADIVFVQFPQKGIDDPSGRWLTRFALDGLHYIIECAGPKTEYIVVNLSWGPQTGPHDGTSVLEREIDDFVDEQLDAGRLLIVTLPAGNSFGSRAHAQVNYSAGGKVSWVVPPDGHTPAFFEVWWPAGVAPSKSLLRITAPDGKSTSVDPTIPWTEKKWYAHIKTVGSSTKALVVVHPTELSNDMYRGQHGVWTIEFPPGAPSVNGDVHVYVARADHNMGARRRAKANYLTDAALEASRFVSPDKRFDETSNSAIRRAGTMNGIATGDYSWVAAGYRHSDGQAAPYSSSGPTRGARTGPDYAFVTEISAANAGVRATGVRNGTRVRLSGSSMAAPQLARQLVHGLNGKAAGPNPPNATERFGGGRIKPDPSVIHKS